MGPSMASQTQTLANKGGQISPLHVLVVCLSLMLTLFAWQYSKQQVEKRTQQRFEAARDQAVALISERMTKYEDALWAGVAAVESHSGSISQAEWRTFAQKLRIEQRYIGINGIGIIHYQTDETLDDYVTEQRRLRPDFRVFPNHDQAMHMPITFIEPENTNAAAVGLDVAHETNRRMAALAARDSGTAQITGPIVLVQDAEQTPGFLFFAPIYEGSRLVSESERQQSFIGAVYAPFVTHKLMEGVLAKELRDVRFSIRDDDRLIYDEHAQTDALTDPKPMFSENVELELYGRTWTLDMRTDLEFRRENAVVKPTLILIAGLIVEVLIVALLYLMSSANKRAIAFAKRMTTELKQEKVKLLSSNAKLTKTNEELERFSYVASHDLKTPMRGISGLTEMIEEDLQDYFASPNCDPEVGVNLKRIHKRVKRMQDLTSGILEVSKIDTRAYSNEASQLEEIVAGLRFDFELSETQLVFEDNDVEIACDTVNFRSVLENLVGNAIKYHDGKTPIRVVVSAEFQAGFLNVSVADNGPGIDPKYHDRIFEAFQTLREKGAPESTGIGLSIVKKAVERHGGSVTIISSVGHGATFRFVWPLAQQTKPSFWSGKAA